MMTLTACLLAVLASLTQEGSKEQTKPLPAPISNVTNVPIEAPAQTDGWSFKPSAGLDLSADLRPSISPNSARLSLVAEWNQGSFKFVAKPKVKLSFQPGQAGTVRLKPDVKELYGAQKIRAVELRFGRIEQRFGHQADFLHVGTLITEDHMRSFADIGLSTQTKLQLSKDWSLQGWGQYFLLQGDALALGRAEPFRLDHFRRRNTVILRIAPTWQPGERIAAGFGLSNQIYAYHTPGKPDPSWIGRTAVDVTGKYKAVAAFFETGTQWSGQEPSKDHFDALGNHVYLWSGVALQLHPMLSLRQHVSYVQPIQAMQHQPLSLHIQPGLEVTFNKQFSLVSQFNLGMQHQKGPQDSWQRKKSGLEISLAASL